MKHNRKKFAKVLRRLNKAQDITLKEKGDKLMIQAANGEQYLAHIAERAIHPLRRWLKQNTSVKNLKV